MTAPRRRWFRFSLRTLFVVVTVVGCWLGYSLNWIRERHEMLDSSAPFLRGTTGSAPAPWLLRPLGEPGIAAFVTSWRVDSPDARNLQRLFPEAAINGYPAERP